MKKKQPQPKGGLRGQPIMPKAQWRPMKKAMPSKRSNYGDVPC